MLERLHVEDCGRASLTIELLSFWYSLEDRIQNTSLKNLPLIDAVFPERE